MSIDITLEENNVAQNPFVQFEKWYKDAIMNQVSEPEAMVVATVGANNRPSSRVVYLRDFSTSGFVFYTNYRSRKGKEIASNPYACLNFFWKEIGRQVRIEGKITTLGAEESDAYFSLRPEMSRIGAWASAQSEIIASREVLEEKVRKFTQEFEGREVTRPSWWGGFILVPDYFEFWQGRDSRLHDRIIYSLDETTQWKTGRLSP